MSKIGTNESNKYQNRPKKGLDGRGKSDRAKNNLNDFKKGQRISVFLNETTEQGETQKKKNGGFPNERQQALHDFKKGQKVSIFLNETTQQRATQKKKKGGFPNERRQASSSKSKFGNRKFGLKTNSRKPSSNIANQIIPKLIIGSNSLALGPGITQNKPFLNSKFLYLKQTNKRKQSKSVSPLIGYENSSSKST